MQLCLCRLLQLSIALRRLAVAALPEAVRRGNEDDAVVNVPSREVGVVAAVDGADGIVGDEGDDAPNASVDFFCTE